MGLWKVSYETDDRREKKCTPVHRKACCLMRMPLAQAKLAQEALVEMQMLGVRMQAWEVQVRTGVPAAASVDTTHRRNTGTEKNDLIGL